VSVPTISFAQGCEIGNLLVTLPDMTIEDFQQFVIVPEGLLVEAAENA